MSKEPIHLFPISEFIVGGEYRSWCMRPGEVASEDSWSFCG